MFEASEKPRIFALPCGVNFAEAFVDGLLTRSNASDPTALAKVQIYVNTARMQRSIREVFDRGPARLLPQIRLIGDLATDPVVRHLPQPVSPLRRRLELSQLVSKLLDQQPDLAPRAALYDLSDSLARLMDEMHGENVSPEAINQLDVRDESGHWQRALAFLTVMRPYFAATSDAPDKEARQRMVVDALAAHWATSPPEHPIIIAGSTGSRGTTAAFMQTVASLPLGAVVLPGFDFGQPDDVWQTLKYNSDAGYAQEDHPQFRFLALMEQTGLAPRDVQTWGTAPAPAPTRNALISLSLRPAPVTNQWLSEGPKLQDIAKATSALTLVEAPSPRIEAEAIALRMRQAVENGETVALISPDRMLTRQVSAALQRWNILPDDSAGTPLPMSAPGRMLRHVAGLFAQRLTAEALLVLLKHPLCHAGHPERGTHLRHTRDLELHLRRHGAPFPNRDSLIFWAEKDPQRLPWVDWLIDLVCDQTMPDHHPLADFLSRHLDIAARLCAGIGAEGAGELWDQAAGREAQRICHMLQDAADAAGRMSAQDYGNMFGAILADGVVRNPDAGHPQVLIWGTLEARVATADLTILGGMNDGIWPEAPRPDPWLNRAMRKQAGLLSPERQIGLSAHDYQQAVAAKEVWITRAIRSADAETVPSRWVNRLTNLLAGLAENGGPEALAEMRKRGQIWVAEAAQIAEPEAPVPPAPRPAPCPPASARPQQLSVTQIKTLVADPYAIYARKVLNLNPVDPLVPSADAPLKGIIIHEILERFISNGHAPQDSEALFAIAAEVFAEKCPWPVAHAQWSAGFAQAGQSFLCDEALRQTRATTQETELAGAIDVATTGVKLVCKADRIDLNDAGEAFIYDYKTGQVPSKIQQLQRDKQLLLEAAMVERGAFAGIGTCHVALAEYIPIKPKETPTPAPLAEETPDQVWENLIALLTRWQTETQGFTARRLLWDKKTRNDYDHLSRFGEWDVSQPAQPEHLT